MTNKILGGGVLAAAMLLGNLAFAQTGATAVGLWKTIDDETGKPKGLVRIYEEYGELFGKLEKTLIVGDENKVCEKCTDERKDQPVVGMMIIRHMRAEDGAYADGDILDPHNGSVYRCKMHLEENGAKLVVRGFIGISLFGRSQTWLREE